MDRILLQLVKKVFFRRWHVIAGLIKKHRFESYVEVGVWKADTTSYVLKKCPSLKMVVGVDDYKNFESMKHSLYQFKEAEKLARKRIGKRLMVCSSIQASEKFEDNSLDIVFIDADHTYKAVKKDIQLWWPKVRTGGILAGHDYDIKHMGVVNAVSAHFIQFYLGADSVWYVKKGEFK